MVSSAVQEKLDAGLRRVPDQTHFECKNRMGDLFSGTLSFLVESLKLAGSGSLRIAKCIHAEYLTV
jgi:hypothetical protein